MSSAWPWRSKISSSAATVAAGRRLAVAVAVAVAVQESGRRRSARRSSRAGPPRRRYRRWRRTAPGGGAGRALGDGENRLSRRVAPDRSRRTRSSSAPDRRARGPASTPGRWPSSFPLSPWGSQAKSHARGTSDADAASRATEQREPSSRCGAPDKGRIGCQLSSRVSGGATATTTTTQGRTAVAIQLKAGLRLRSATDACEVVVVKAPADPVDLRCGGHPFLAADAAPASESIVAGFDGGTQLGKRYSDDEHRPGAPLHQGGRRVHLGRRDHPDRQGCQAAACLGLSVRAQEGEKGHRREHRHAARNGGRG